MSFPRVLRIVALLLMALLVTGCGNKSSGSKSASVRFVNALVDAGAINVVVGNNNAVTGLPFEGISGYIQVNSGTQEFKTSVSGGTSTVIDQNLNLGGDQYYTYVVYGTASAPLSAVLPDTVSTPNSGVFLLRVTNAAFGTQALDVYVTAPGASLASSVPNISNIQQNGTSGFASLTPGTLQVRFTLANSKQVIYDSGSLPFANQASYEIVAYTRGSSTLVNGAVLSVNTSGAGLIVNSQVAQFKMIHAAPGTGAVNVFVDSGVALANIPYLGASSYSIVAAGPHTVNIEAAATPGATIATAQPPFAAATDTSIVLTGTPGATTALVLNDNNLPGSAGRARVRFVNVAPALGAVDVYVNFAPRVTALATNTASGYTEYVDDTYAINFDLAGTTNVVLSLPSVALAAGRTYTIYLVGTPGALAAVVTADD
ncbi:MAG: DUF4397 domain-containing protein [Casimicrobiaceae bacterium]